MKDLINAKKVMQLLHMNVSAKQIAEEVGVAAMTITRYRKSDDISAMQLELAAKLEDYYDQLIEEGNLTLKITGIRKAVGEFNNTDMAARMYFDPSDMSVWVNEYPDSNSWDNYHDPKITQLMSKDNLHGGRTSMREVQQRAKEYLDEEVED